MSLALSSKELGRVPLQGDSNVVMRGEKERTFQVACALDDSVVVPHTVPLQKGASTYFSTCQYIDSHHVQNIS